MKANTTVHSPFLPSLPRHYPIPSKIILTHSTPQDRAYYAEVGVGLRGVTYRAHGEKFWFNPDTVEDVDGERWVFDKKLWCPGK